MRSAAVAIALAAYLLTAPATAEGAAWRWPVEGPVITTYANGTDPFAGGQHRGIDIAAPAGTTVVAAVGGSVRFGGSLGSSGLTVAVRTDDGFDTSYLHLGSIGVRAGDRVTAGAAIGSVGTTGRRSAPEPHLHFGVREAGTRFAYRDPLGFLPLPAPASRPPASLPVAATAPARPAPEPLALPATVRHGPAPVTAFGRPQPVAAFPKPVTAVAGSEPVAAFRKSVGAFTRPQPVAALRRPVTAIAGPEPVATLGRPAPRLRAAPGGSQTPRPLQGPAHPTRGGTDSGQMWDGIRATSPVRVPAVVSAARRVPSRAAPGFDLGWLAACIAMVVAAAILGRPRATTRSLRRAFDVPFAGASSEPDPR